MHHAHLSVLQPRPGKGCGQNMFPSISWAPAGAPRLQHNKTRCSARGGFYLVEYCGSAMSVTHFGTPFSNAGSPQS
eukprot:884822-Pelagomonas_calceolata.AAC.3